jgi:hypothetical protein
MARVGRGPESPETRHWRGDSRVTHFGFRRARRCRIGEVKTAVRVGTGEGGLETKTRDPLPVSRDSIEESYQTGTGVSTKFRIDVHLALNETV